MVQGCVHQFSKLEVLYSQLAEELPQQRCQRVGTNTNKAWCGVVVEYSIEVAAIPHCWVTTTCNSGWNILVWPLFGWSFLLFLFCFLGGLGCRAQGFRRCLVGGRGAGFPAGSWVRGCGPGPGYLSRGTLLVLVLYPGGGVLGPGSARWLPPRRRLPVQ
jgi:hypothetical protein